MVNCAVSLTKEGRKATLRICRPEALNALNLAVLSDLRALVQAVRVDAEIGIVVLASEGEKAFVAGADIKEMQHMSAQQATAFSQLGSETFAELASLPQIVIARVQGFALGGGLELALAADLIVATQNARFGLPEVSLGLIPGFGGTQRLARRIGFAHALEWAATARKYTSDDALRVGLINHVFENAEKLDAFLTDFVKDTARNGPLALRALKSALKAAQDGSQSMGIATGFALETSLFGLQFATAEAQEGTAAFLENVLLHLARQQVVNHDRRCAAQTLPSDLIASGFESIG